MSLELVPKYEITVQLTGAGSGELYLGAVDAELHLDLVPLLQGPPGKDGDPGAPGAGGSTYLHSQLVGSATWVVNHDLNRRVAIELQSLGGLEIDAAIVHTSLNQAIVYFNVPTVGYAICQ